MGCRGVCGESQCMVGDGWLASMMEEWRFTFQARVTCVLST